MFFVILTIAMLVIMYNVVIVIAMNSRNKNYKDDNKYERKQFKVVKEWLQKAKQNKIEELATYFITSIWTITVVYFFTEKKTHCRIKCIKIHNFKALKKLNRKVLKSCSALIVI